MAYASLGAGEKRLTRIPITVSSSGDNTIVAATGANTRIRVVNIVLIASGTVSITFYTNSSSGTALTGTIPLTAQVGFAPGEATRYGHFETASNQPLVLNLNANVGVNGWLVYTTTMEGK